MFSFSSTVSAQRIESGWIGARIDAVVRAHFRHEGIEPFGPDLAQRLQRLEARVASRQIEHVDIAAELGAIDPADRGVQALHADQHFGMGTQAFADGAATMVSSLGMALGPWAGGMIFDTFHDYRWLYIGALSVGLGARAIALAFPPLPSRSRERLQPA